jgi:uncharacterized cupredoxin-like copper-binding protein
MKMSHARLTVLALVSAASALFVAVPAMAHNAAKKATTVTVTAGKPSEFGFILSSKKLKHGTVTFKVTNKGAIPHDFKICSSNKGGTANACVGKVTKQLNAGQSATLTVTFAKAGTYEYLCTVPAHAANGMKGDLKVT